MLERTKKMKEMVGWISSLILIIYAFVKFDRLLGPKVGPVGNGLSDSLVTTVWVLFTISLVLGFGGLIYYTYLMIKRLLGKGLETVFNSFEQDGLILKQERIQLLAGRHADQTEAFRIHYQSDGLMVVGFIVKPKEITGKAPLLIFNRGGAENRSLIDIRMLSNFLALLASKGFVVMASQYRGNDGGEGQDRWGGEDINDVMNLVEAAKQLDYADTDRKVMLGISRGGLMTYLAIRNQLDLRAAVVMCGPTDLLDLYEQREESMKEILRRLVGEPSINSDEYSKRSPIQWADQINVPLFIMHGAEDNFVPVQQVRDFVRKLNELGKSCKYTEYPEGDHFLLKGRFEEVTEEIAHYFHRHTQ